MKSVKILETHCKLGKIRVPLPKQTEKVFRDKKKYDRKKDKKKIEKEINVRHK